MLEWPYIRTGWSTTTVTLAATAGGQRGGEDIGGGSGGNSRDDGGRGPTDGRRGGGGPASGTAWLGVHLSFIFAGMGNITSKATQVKLRFHEDFLWMF